MIPKSINTLSNIPSQLDTIANLKFICFSLLNTSIQSGSSLILSFFISSHLLGAPSAQMNELNREFQQELAKKVIVSDLTYIRVKNKWHYICVLMNLFNREIIGFSTGSRKDNELVARAFASIQGDLRDIQMFHTDRGSEFKNQLLTRH